MLHVFVIHCRTEWDTPVPDFPEVRGPRFPSFNHPIFRPPLEGNSLLLKKSLRLPKPLILPQPQQPLQILMSPIALFTISKPHR